MGPNTHTNEWSLADDDLDTALMGPATSHDIDNAGDVQLDDAARATDMLIGKAYEETQGGKTESARDRPVGKANKIYIGGLPDHTRPEDLQNCFGKMGHIAAIELKLGYGFVEFESKESAEESVARYHEGYFMGNKIRVEHSHSRGRTFKRTDDPGACFRCGENGHWARECPRPNTQSRGGTMNEPSSHDRSQSNRDYHHHGARDGHSYRDEYSRHPSTRDDRLYDAAPPQAQDRRRPQTPPRERADYSSRRQNDDHEMQSPTLPPTSRYDRTGYQGSEREYPASGAPRDSHGRHDRRPAPTEDRSVPNQGQSRRPRTPPGPPPRDDHDKAPRHQTQESRRRPATPPPPYPGSSANGYRSRRRSLSPPPRYDSRYGGQAHTEGERHSGPRESTRVRDYYRNNRGEDSGYRRS